MSDYGSIPPPPPLPPPSPYGFAVAGGYPPPNYLVWAILSTVLFCLPFGIASIVFSTQVNTRWAMGDAAGAQAASGKAKKFAIWGAIIGVVLDILSVVFVVVVHGMGTQLKIGTGF